MTAKTCFCHDKDHETCYDGLVGIFDPNCNCCREKNSAEYLDHWLKKQKADPKLLGCGRCGEADRTKGEHGLGRCVTFRYR